VVFRIARKRKGDQEKEEEERCSRVFILMRLLNASIKTSSNKGVRKGVVV
jgi:hypothetical protein